MSRSPAPDRRAVLCGSASSPASPRTTRPFAALSLHLARLALLAITLVPHTVRAADGVLLCGAAHDQYGTVAAADGRGGTYVAWVDGRLGYNTDVVLTHVDRDLLRPSGWVADGNRVTFITCQKTDIAMLADSSGAWLAWSDTRCAPGAGYDIYAMRMTSAGKAATGFPANGLAVNLGANDQVHSAIASDGSGGIFVVWTDQGAAPARLWAHHVLANATLDPLWPAAGLLVSSTVPDSTRASVASDGAHGMFVAWEDTRGADADLMIARIAGNGAPASGWSAGGMLLTHATGVQYAPQLQADGSGGVTAAWADRRAGSARVYAKHVDALGAATSGWPADGRAVGMGAGEQTLPCALADSAGGALFAWQDARDAGVAAVYVQHLDAFGAPLAGWAAAGVRACSSSGAEVAPSLASDAQGGMFVTWLDGRRGLSGVADLYAQRLGAGGAPAPGWPASGRALCDVGGDRGDVALVADGQGDAFVAWSDARALATQGKDIAATKLLPGGPSVIQASALQALHHDGQTFLTWHPPLGNGWTFRLYRASQPIVTNNDLNAATVLGTVGDSSACDRRLSVLQGQVHGFAIDSLVPPLDPSLGLFVYTPAATSEAYYAVTAQSRVFGETRLLTGGDNTLLGPVTEFALTPRPVYQRDTVLQQIRVSLYTLWVSAHDTPYMQAMANTESLPFDCGVTKPVTALGETSLLLPLHHRGGNLLESYSGTKSPGEFVLALDDYLPNGAQTFWYGYATTFDERAALGAPPTTGVVVDYTQRRIMYSIDWALRTFGIDPGRVFVYGYSMGGVGAMTLAFRHGDRIAGAISIVGNVDMSYTSDPDTACAFSLNGYLRKEVERFWGTLATNLPTIGGRGLYDELDQTARTADAQHPTVPPVFAFVGKRDSTMGWALNLPFYSAMDAARRGGAFYWEDGTHEPVTTPAWQPQRDPRTLYRYRTDRSFPAISRCSIDDDPGDGIATHGAMLGTIHGYVQWDSLVTDTPTLWQVGLRLQTLVLTDRTLLPPDSADMDITPRRVQRFVRTPGSTIAWKTTLANDTTVIQHGTAIVDAGGDVTIPAVRVHESGIVLSLGSSPTLGAGLEPPARLRPGISFARSPVRGPTAFRIVWPGGGLARADLYDIHGRAIRALYRGVAGDAPLSLTFEPSGLPAGVYLVGAEVAGRRVSGRVVVLR